MTIELDYARFLDHINIAQCPILFFNCNSATPYMFVTQFNGLMFKFHTASSTERDYIIENFKVTELSSKD